MLLPSTISSATNLVKLPALAELFERASWQQTLTHLLNADPNISGAALISTLISTHTETDGASSNADGLDSGSGPHLLTVAPFLTALSVINLLVMHFGSCPP